VRPSAVQPAERPSGWRQPPPAAGAALRILFIAPYPPARDGIGNYTFELARGLRRQHCEIAVVTPEPVPGSADARLLGSLGSLGSLGGDSSTRLASAVREWAPDVVHVQFAVAAFGRRLPELLRLLAGTEARTVVTAHEVTRDLARLGPLGRALYRRVARRADCVVVHTDAAAGALSQLGIATPIEVLDHPVLPVPRSAASEDELRRRFGLLERKVLLAFGFVHPHKGLDDLVAAFAAARRGAAHGLDRFTIVVAGDVRRRAGAFRLLELVDRCHAVRVRRAVRRFGLSDRTVFTGYVPDGEVAAWFRVADVAVLPYRKIEQSGVLSLARALRVPVIASDAGGLAGGCSPAWSYPAGDRASLAGLLGRLELERPPPAEAAGARDVVSFAEATMALYRDPRAPRARAGGPSRPDLGALA